MRTHVRRLNTLEQDRRSAKTSLRTYTRNVVHDHRAFEPFAFSCLGLRSWSSLEAWPDSMGLLSVASVLRPDSPVRCPPLPGERERERERERGREGERERERARERERDHHHHYHPLRARPDGRSAGPKATQLPLSAAQRVEGDEGVQMERRGGLCDGGRMGGGWDREGWRWRRGRR